MCMESLQLRERALQIAQLLPISPSDADRVLELVRELLDWRLGRSADARWEQISGDAA